jgi:hypothetical protein
LYDSWKGGGQGKQAFIRDKKEVSSYMRTYYM